MNRFKNILYVTETAVDQDSAVARAVSLAENNQAKLTIIDVIPSVSPEFRQRATADRLLVVEGLSEPYRKRLKIEFDVRSGPVFLEVIRAVLRNSHDLVIKAAENPDFLKRVFGSSDMHLLRKCPSPVWLMKPPEKPKYNCILAAVDFNPVQSVAEEQTLNQEIIELAGSLALADFASLHLVHAWEGFAEGVMRRWSDTSPEDLAAHVEKERLGHQEGLHLLGERLRERIGAEAYSYLSPHFHLPKGAAQRKIAALATELRADLVVMGTVARTGIPGFIIGNTAEAILDQLSCSVLAIKPPGFTSPVRLAG